MKRFGFIVALLVLSALPISAQVLNSPTCSQADVQNTFNSITTSTTTVNIPGCTGGSIGTWTGMVTATIPSGSTATVFSILGAGNLTVTGGGDATIIQDNDTADSNPILNIQILATNPNEEVRIAGISFENGTGQTKYNGLVQVNASTDNIRMDHNHFVTSSSGSSSTQWQGCANGVADHNIFDGGGVSNAVRAYNHGSCNGDTLGIGDNSWNSAPGYGTAKFLFMEDNIFNAGASDDCTDGGAFVARHNTYNAEAPAPTVQTHPTGGAGRIRGCRAQEVYLNSFLPVSGNYIDTRNWDSSGSVYDWGNTTTSSSAGGGTGYDAFFKYIEMRQNNNTYSQGVPPAGWGYCGTSQTGSASNWDDNTNASGYPCMDAPGGGQGDKLIGGFTIDGSGSNNVENQTTGCLSSSACAWPRQAQEGVYMWDNSFSPTPSNPTTFFANQYSGTNINVDYWQDCPGNGCSGSFTGAAGVGQGTLASIPGTCTKGVGYFATDQGNWNHSGSGGQGVLYKCTATNTWTAAYTPYTYPHPLVSGGGTITTPTQFSGKVVISGKATLQ